MVIIIIFFINIKSIMYPWTPYLLCSTYVPFLFLWGLNIDIIRIICSSLCWPRVNIRWDIAPFLDYVQIDSRVRIFGHF